MGKEIVDIPDDSQIAENRKESGQMVANMLGLEYEDLKEVYKKVDDILE